MGNEVQILSGDADQAEDTGDFVRVCTSSDPADGTITLATIQRFVARPVDKRDEPWRVKTLILDKPMSLDAALGLATCYAKRKKIPVVFTDGGGGKDQRA